MKIAVLIPVCNCERYLRECLDSVLAQTGCEIEICCRDDGSTDGSRDILSDYAARYPNVRFAVQENAGVSVARNRLLDGLPEDAEAFAFVDADDWVAPGMYAALSGAMMRTDADVAECEWNGAETVIDDMSVFVLRRTAPGRWINVWNKLYRRTAAGAIRFRGGLCFEEDLFFNFEVHRAIRRKVLVPGRFYNYRANPGSATSVLNQRKYFDSTTCRIRLSLEEFLNAGRIPAALAADFRRELTKDAYRMCVRKNLRRNRDAPLRRDLFRRAGLFLESLERDCGFRPTGLNPLQRLIWTACRSGCYRTARLMTLLT